MSPNPPEPPRRPTLDWRVPVPDEVLLRRYGLVRAVGGGGYIVAVLVLLGIFGWQVWPLALGVPVLAVATTAYFLKSADYPRTAVIASLAADALVLGGAVSYLGGTGSGLVMLYAIVLVSAGILLGPGTATAFTVAVIGLGLLQLALEQLGVEPALLHRPDLGARMPILLASLAGLAGVGYLSATYAGRLHELVVQAGAQVEAAHARGRRRRSFVTRARLDVQRPLKDIEAVAHALQTADLDVAGRQALAARLRMDTTQLDAEIGQLADLGVLDAPADTRPEPIRLDRVVGDCVLALGDRLAPYALGVDVGPIKVLGDRRAARRVVFNLLENVVEHTPPGTRARVAAATTAGQAVLAVSDDGPGVPAAVAERLFESPEREPVHVGLPLVRLLCEAMGAEVRYEPLPGGDDAGGSRFLVAFRLAPAAAPGPDDEVPAARR